VPIPAEGSFVDLCKKIQSAYALIPATDPSIPVKVLDWKKVIEDTVSSIKGNKFTVEIEFVAPAGSLVKGILTRYDDSRAKIFVSDKESFCVRRFIVAKELAHIILDHHSEYTVNPGSLMSKLISRVPLHRLTRDNDQDVASFLAEKLAVAGAIEMLLPWASRAYFEDRFFIKGDSPQELAVALRVPKVIVQEMVSPYYWPASQEANIEAANS
jgi:hypothetical protein